MNKVSSKALMLLGALVAASTVGGAQAQPPAERTVEQYRCKDILRDGGAPREVAVAFLHGFLLGKSGSSRFNIETLMRQTDDFIERCLDNPNEAAMTAMMAVKK